MFGFLHNLSGTSTKSRQGRKAPPRKTSLRLQVENLERRQMFASLPFKVPVATAAHNVPISSFTKQAIVAPTASPVAAQVQIAPKMAVAATSGTLESAMSAQGSSVMYVRDWRSFPNPTNGFFIVQIDNEKIEVNGGGSGSGPWTLYSVTRGVLGTTVQAHAKGATVTLVTNPTAPAGTQAAFANFGGALWQHTGTNQDAGWSKIWDVGVTSFSASTVSPNTVFVNIGGALWHHVGTDRNTGWSKIWDTGVKQVSAGVQIGVGQARANVAFVLFNSGALYEHVGTDKNAGWFKLRDSGVTQISASQGQADTVFVNFSGAVWEHNGRDAFSGWTKVWDVGITDLAASSIQADTVFVNFSGALWQHSGKDKNLGWTKVWDVGVSQFSVAQTQINTVYVTINGGLWQHVGLDRNSGWSKLWDVGTTKISAAPQNDTVFALIGGGFWIHIGKDKNVGWFKLRASGVTDIGGAL